MSRWGDDRTCKFVEQYKKHECLWNSKFENYKNRKIRYEAYEDIVTVMNLPKFDIIDVRNKIKTLRTTFIQEYRKALAAKKTADNETIYRPRSRWYSIMQTIIFNEFGERLLPKRNSNSFIKNITRDNDDDINPLEVEFFSFDEEPRKSPSTELECSKRIKTNDNSNNIQNNTAETSTNNLTIIEDEFHYFGINIACQLRQLPIDKALRLQIDIQSRLAEERIALFEGNLYEKDF